MLTRILPHCPTDGRCLASARSLHAHAELLRDGAEAPVLTTGQRIMLLRDAEAAERQASRRLRALRARPPCPNRWTRPGSRRPEPGQAAAPRVSARKRRPGTPAATALTGEHDGPRRIATDEPDRMRSCKAAGDLARLPCRSAAQKRQPEQAGAEQRKADGLGHVRRVEPKVVDVAVEGIARRRPGQGDQQRIDGLP